MIAVAAVALLAGVAGAALATTSSASSATDASATPTPPAAAASPAPGSRVPGPWPAFRGPLGHGAPGGGFFAGPGGVVHGQVVVPQPGGTYRTEDIQTGTVTAVSSSSLTMRSADGYTKTYQVTSTTRVAAGRTGIGSVKVGHQVAVTATVHGSTASLTRVIDLSLLGAGKFAPRWGGQPPAAG
jgi:hypothetical protein